LRAIELYCLLVKTQGNISENNLDWALYDILEALFKPLGLGTWPVDCPTDQMAFL
jgi:hypothetical protein